MSEPTYVFNTLEEHGLSWFDVDRLLLKRGTYEWFMHSDEYPTATYSTTAAPAVRETTGPEKVIYVTEDGRQEEITF